MTKLNFVLTVILILSLSAMPILYMAGMQRYSEQLDAKIEAHSEQIREENKQLGKLYEVTLKATLAEKEGEWDRQQEELRSYVRELLLNSGVLLEQLDAPQEPEEPNFVVTQESYETLKKGQSYSEVLECLDEKGTIF